MKKTIKFLLILILFSCKNNQSQNSINDDVKQLSYDEIILKIVKSSNLDTKIYPNYSTLTDRIENDSIIIKAYIENDVSDNPNEPRIVESAIAWLVLIPKKEKLFDITSDPKKPIDLIFNKILCKELIKDEIYNNYQKKNETMENNKTKFSDVIIEKSTIKFKPSDLEKTNDIEILNFKKRLDTYIEQNPEKKDFDIQNLLYLINNETFSNSEGFIDSSWLYFFIKKYKIDNNELVDLMDTIIEQEDLNAFNVLIKNGYIFSFKELKRSEEKKKAVDLIIRNNDIEDYYDKEYSKINDIAFLINQKYASNHIQDSDGYTNLRKGKGTNFDVIEKINTNTKINVLDNTGDWFLVKTKSGVEGYVYKSKIITE